jgi:hypothetical protein
MNPVRTWRVRAEVAIGLLSALTLAATLVWPDWIERLTGLDPDGGNGAIEWEFVFALVVVTLAAFGLAWRDLRRPS